MEWSLDRQNDGLIILGKKVEIWKCLGRWKIECWKKKKNVILRGYVVWDNLVADMVWTHSKRW